MMDELKHNLIFLLHSAQWWSELVVLASCNPPIASPHQYLFSNNSIPRPTANSSMPDLVHTQQSTLPITIIALWSRSQSFQEGDGLMVIVLKFRHLLGSPWVLLIEFKLGLNNWPNKHPWMNVSRQSKTHRGKRKWNSQLDFFTFRLSGAIALLVYLPYMLVIKPTFKIIIPAMYRSL